MAQQQEKKNGSTARRFRAAWDAGRLDEACELLQTFADDLTDGYNRLHEEPAAKLALNPTKALKQFLVLCGDEETVKILLTSSLGLAQKHPLLALNMSRLVASIPHFSKLTETLVKCEGLDFLTEFLKSLPQLVDRATRAPYDSASLIIASNLIITAVFLRKSQDGFHAQLLRDGALDALLDSVPFRNGHPNFSRFQLLGKRTLELISAALYLTMDLSSVRGIQHGEGAELRPKIVDWSQSLLELVCEVLEAPRDAYELGSLPQDCIDGVLRLLNGVGKGAPGAFDFRPSIRRATPHLALFPGDRAQILSIVEALKRASRIDAARERPGTAEPGVLFSKGSPLGFMTFRLLQEAFASRPLKAHIEAITELATFVHKRNLDPDYGQADLHERGSLFPLVPQILGVIEAWPHSELESVGDLVITTLFVIIELFRREMAIQLGGVPSDGEAEQLEKAALRLLTWLRLHHSIVRRRMLLFRALITVGECANATWASLAALLNAGRFLVFCKEWFEANAQRVTVEETEDFVYSLLTPLEVPLRGMSELTTQTAVRGALTKDGMLTWVFERAARAATFKFTRRPNLLPLLALCSQVQVDFSAFLTPELFRLFVRQLVHSWGGIFRAAILPAFEKDDVMFRSMADEVNRLAGHVRIVETMLCGSRRDASGKWDPGYLADVRAAVADGAQRSETATFMTFCEGEGVAAFASIMEERERLERFRARAEREGFLLPEAADVARRVEGVWELVAAAFNLHKCANAACPRVEKQKGTFLMCGKCKNARYCGQGCQLADWKAGHKRECQARAKVQEN